MTEERKVRQEDTNLRELFAEHIKADKEFQEKLSRVLFGDDINQKGAVDKINDVYEILTSARNVTGFFNSFVGGSLKWLIIVAAVVGILKGWWADIIGIIITHIK